MLALFLLTGPIPTIMVFTAAYFCASGEYGPLRSILYSALVTVAIYALFIQALGVQNEYGLLEQWIGNL